MKQENENGNKKQIPCLMRNPGRDIYFPIFIRKAIETKRIRKEIKTIKSGFINLILTSNWLCIGISDIASLPRVTGKLLVFDSKTSNFGFSGFLTVFFT